MNPLLSVIIPLYNTAEYIARSIHSVYASGLTSAQMEVIVINDGSTDQSEEIVKSLQSTYPSLKLFSQENRGLSGARNRGVAEASGDYIFFVDSDDYVDSKQLHTLVSTQPTADIITFPALKMRDGKQIGKLDRHTHYSAQEYPQQRYEMAVWCYWFKLDLITRHGLLFEERSTSEDFLFTTQYILSERHLSLYTHSQPLYLYCQRDNSITHQPTPAARNKLIDDKISAMNLLLKRLNTEQLKRIEKRLRFFALEVPLLCLAHSLPRSKFNESFQRLNALGLYPFPHRSYGYKYIVFATIANQPNLLYALRKVLVYAIRL